MTEQEALMGIHGYAVELNWVWGGCGPLGGSPLREIHRFVIGDLSQLDDEVKAFVVWMTRQYAFDCGQLHMPLRPGLCGMRITPVAVSRWESTERFDALVEREIAHTKILIESGDLYRGGGYNLEPAPEVV